MLDPKWCHIYTNDFMTVQCNTNLCFTSNKLNDDVDNVNESLDKLKI